MINIADNRSWALNHENENDRKKKINYIFTTGILLLIDEQNRKGPWVLCGLRYLIFFVQIVHFLKWSIPDAKKNREKKCASHEILRQHRKPIRAIIPAKWSKEKVTILLKKPKRRKEQLENKIMPLSIQFINLISIKIYFENFLLTLSSILLLTFEL